ncbi:F-box/WD repeat-containing protein 8 [Danio rerio]|uniref:F-box/WD repeat-containing protein 8 n=1 Tax=Danio rerio TaxID=7955 RepID=A9JRF9_DANRE|nr:F-box/WD repeat-containing protein 8 [Danio rerio]AAI55645.1 Zgc:172294 protein [Danio rerio]|eukprot:NP_001108050.1 F-box/WD repeat-containing protein 8 [Danio rerio]
MGTEEDELSVFRDRWKQELNKSTKAAKEKEGYFGDQNKDGSSVHQSTSFWENQSSVSQPTPKEQPEYVSIAEGLLDGRSGPLLDRLEHERTRTRKRAPESEAPKTDAPPKKVNASQKLLEQFLQDLNEVNDIPFFDVELPYELALKIFNFLGRTDLGRCAQVSKSWKVLAEDELLWYRLCLEEGFQKGANISDSPCWKSTVRDCRNTENAVKSNWKNRVGSIRHLQYELGKVLCDVSSCAGLVIAGYTSGDVRLWDTLHWDKFYLKPTHSIRNETPAPYASHVRVNKTIAAAAYENGCVDVWSTVTGLEPIHQYQHLQRVHVLDLSPDGPALASASGPDVRVDAPDEQGYWRSQSLVQLPKPVDGVLVVPGKRDIPLVTAWAGESVYLLNSRPEEEQEPRVLHSVYGHPVTCVDTSPSRAAMGIKSCGWGMNDGGNKIQVYGLESGQCELTMGNSAGDFTCVNLRDSGPHLLLCGNRDRRVRVFDLRTGSSVLSLYAHHMGVTAVQADDWRIVSGGGEGLVIVWEMRIGAKLWEMHNRHPVRHIRFSSSTLVTANIPDEKSPRGACITDDDLTAHRRYRGLICHYDFSMDSSSQDHILPICRSNYAESSGYNYNIGLSMPYDTLSGP